MVWTQADWLYAVPLNHELIDEFMDDRMPPLLPNGPPDSDVMLARARAQLGEARGRTDAGSINLHALAATIFEHRSKINDNRTMPWSGTAHRPMVADQGVDVTRSSQAKIRFLDFMDAESRVLGNKEMENFVLYVMDSVTSMMDVFDSIQQLSQARGGP